MSSAITKIKILESTAKLFSVYGYSGLNIRDVAKDVGVAHSVLYHHYKDKDLLLKNMFDYTNEKIGLERKNLPHEPDPYKMLRQRIEFQIDHMMEVVAILKYYMHYRDQFKGNSEGFVPIKAYRHIEEVLKLGVSTQKMHVKDIQKDSKVITHAINGFLLEFYPVSPLGRKRDDLVDSIHRFISRSLSNPS